MSEEETIGYEETVEGAKDVYDALANVDYHIAMESSMLFLFDSEEFDFSKRKVNFHETVVSGLDLKAEALGWQVLNRHQVREEGGFGPGKRIIAKLGSGRVVTEHKSGEFDVYWINPNLNKIQPDRVKVQTGVDRDV